ncbi:MAG: FHA domain-containing protein [Gammaproteobacteria bacterium]|nr:MAG: FHA domain-containing protein [Gammaproteobacteria bacterium]
MSGTSAILFADIAGSSRLYKEAGDNQARQLVATALEEMASVVTRLHGRVVKTIGDEIMAQFPSASPAIEAAIQIQRLRHASQPRLLARIGVHFGQTIEQGGDVFGEAVNDAAALVRIAKGGQIITSSDTVRTLGDRLKSQARRFDKIKLKGADESTVIYVIDWEQETTATEATQVMSAINDDTLTIPPGSLLELRYQDKRTSITPNQTPFIVGRDHGIAHLQVLSTVASRDHFRIEFRRGKFVLADNSTNGTWVQLEGQEPIYLRREEVPLTGPGVISVGQAINPDNPHLIRFSF